MKGTTFQKPIEFNLHINGEAWNQGDPISGTVVVRNHGNEPLALADVKVWLAHGALRKVHQKSDDPFDILETVSFETAGQVAPKETATLEWKFALDRNCRITDKSSSLFILYGREAAGLLPGALQLTVNPFQLIQDYLKEFTTQHRFVLKSLRATVKNQVDAKLAPPDSKAFTTLDYISLLIKMDGDNLELKYVFNGKKVEASNASTIEVAKKKKEVKQTLEPKQYRTETGRLNHVFIEQSIKAALSEVEAKVIF